MLGLAAAVFGVLQTLLASVDQLVSLGRRAGRECLDRGAGAAARMICFALPAYLIGSGAAAHRGALAATW